MSNISTQKEKISLYVILVIISTFVVLSTLKQLEKLQNSQGKLLSVSFSSNGKLDLSTTPPFLYYDSNKNELFIKGALSDENENKILTIISSKCEEEQCKYFLDFKSALILLISKSEDLKNRLSVLIFHIALLGGALGAILRLFIDFVGNASYKNTLDFKRWWPLYFTRPITGSILGLIIVILLKSNIISLSLNPNHPESLWWLGLSIIAGFGTIDATERLRLTSKAIFGESKNETQP